MSELKPCAHCGFLGWQSSTGFVRCSNNRCTAKGAIFAGVSHWNDRPRESTLEVRVKELESELAQAKAAAVQWVTYTGEPETLPEPRRKVLISYVRDPQDVEIASLLSTEYWHDHMEHNQKKKINTGDRWAYLPVPPEDSE